MSLHSYITVNYIYGLAFSWKIQLSIILTHPRAVQVVNLVAGIFKSEPVHFQVCKPTVHVLLRQGKVSGDARHRQWRLPWLTGEIKTLWE